ncbi:MAG: hypothetical protein CMH55_08015 [Myxococcales bacterium]|nr:hypothetical protein [Myxococcales bacterium]
MEPLEVLQLNPHLYELDEACLADLCESMGRRPIKKDQLIFEKQEEGRNLFIVAQGRVKVHLHDDAGRELILVVFGPGDLFGEMALLDDRGRSAAVTAVESGYLLVLPRAALEAGIRKHPELGLGLLTMLSERIRDSNEIIFDLAMRDVVQRLARLLILHGDDQKPDDEGLVPLPSLPAQASLAARIGSSRETVSRTMATWRRQGIILTQDRVICLTPAFYQRFEGGEENEET